MAKNNNIIEMFNTCRRTILEDGSKLELPNEKASLLVKHNDEYHIIAIAGASPTVNHTPSVTVAKFDKNFQDIKFSTSGNPTIESFNNRWGFSFENKNGDLVVNDGELLQCVPHYRYAAFSITFSVKLGEGNKFPVHTKTTIPPFPDYHTIVTGGEHEAYRTANVFANFLPEDQIGYLLSNTIYNNKGEHGFYVPKVQSGVKSGKFPYYFVMIHSTNIVSRLTV